MKTNNLLQLSGALVALMGAAPSRLFGASAIARYIDQRSWKNHQGLAQGSIAQRNRHTGKPHEHKREIARRQRQAARA